MSRAIQGAMMHTDEITNLQNSRKGKLLFTSYKEKPFAFLIKGNRLLAVRELSQGDNIGAIYLAKVKNAVTNINANFVEIADGEICFLPAKETLTGKTLKAGAELPVQITRQAQKTKQASVTAKLSLANEYVALTLGASGVGFSNKLSPEQKATITAWLKEAGMLNENGAFQQTAGIMNEKEAFPIAAPAENGKSSGSFSSKTQVTIGCVIRTCAGECDKDRFLYALQDLTEELTGLLQKAAHRTVFSCLRQAAPAYASIFDKMVYPGEYEEIVTDDPTLYGELVTYMGAHDPEKPVRLYEDSEFPLSKLYALDTKMHTALDRRVWLPSGGYLVIDPTEAMTVIDVNSGKYEGKKEASEMAVKINREAAEEIALQLRLRNLSGMILVDFINMHDKQEQDALFHYLKQLTGRDKLQTIVHDITVLGLVEITRKKEYKPLKEQIEVKY